MTEKCDSLKALAELTTRFEKHYTRHGHLNYEAAREIIEGLIHGIQLQNDTNVNDLKKDLGVYHND